MNTLSDRDRELVAIGAAIASNCVPCIEYHVPAARTVGLDDAEIKEAVLLADKVKRVPARKVLETAKSLLSTEESSAALTENEAQTG
jgi:4-carboxymuconolactone decarboxylase|tara:strand:- start:2269 stop:2529 length:261 start_codon:yes stop_codon:yes gene_type:complete